MQVIFLVLFQILRVRIVPYRRHNQSGRREKFRPIRVACSKAKSIAYSLFSVCKKHRPLASDAPICAAVQTYVAWHITEHRDISHFYFRSLINPLY